MADHTILKELDTCEAMLCEKRFICKQGNQGGQTHVMFMCMILHPSQP